MRSFLGIILAASTSIAASADGLLRVEIENIVGEKGRTYLVVRATNGSEQFLDRILFTCTLFSEDGAAIDVYKGRVRTLAAGEYGFDKVPFTFHSEATTAQCRITDVLP